nr:mitoferrin-2-like [Lytechinus pictus]
MEKTSSISRVADFSSPKLESLKKLPRISNYDKLSFRQRISEMDNNDAAEKTSCGNDSTAAIAGHVIDYDDYEALPQSSTLTTHLIAGAFAGMAEHCVMYPFDSVKTRMQSIKPSPNAIYKNVFNGLTTIIRNEGANGTVRGINAVALGAGPAHALYFACYEKLKKVLSSHPGKNPLANAVAGGLATVIHDAAMNPVEGMVLEHPFIGLEKIRGREKWELKVK